jgi:undecaprenyl-phosphate 4-deoxy-4-formamido-L-arabinose transferase
MQSYEPIQSLTISIPAYNDSMSLVKLVDETELLCTQLGIPFQLLIINDGSYDNTLKVARELAHKYGNIEVLSHDKNLGFGETLKKVFMLPETEWVLFLPGDNQFPVSNLHRFLEIKDRYDYMLGFRKERRDKAHRKLYSKVYNQLISFFSGYKVRDVNSIVFYRSKIFDKIQLNGKSAFVHAEFFIRTSRADFRVVEIEIIHQEREFGFGSGGNIRVITATIRDLLLYHLRKAWRDNE